jgi:lysophospholipase L1-like esterase
MNGYRSRPSRARAIVLTATLIGSIGALLLGASGASAASYPHSMASTGDSITRAYNTGFFPYLDNPSASWSTGTNSSVVSHYTRLGKLDPAIVGHAFNDAKSGARMVDLYGQLTTVAGRHVDYVTVLMGGNDVCQPTEAQMTSVADFKAQFRKAMATITSLSPATKVFVVSIPNVYNLWSTLKDDGLARFVWGLFRVCQAMLANPLSTAPADVERRSRVLTREIAFNTVLRRVCAAYRQCRFDGNAVFNVAFTASDITARDFFHPSTAGQKKLAAVSWSAGYWGP